MIRAISLGILILVVNNIHFVYTTGISSNVDFDSEEDTDAEKNLTAILDLSGASPPKSTNTQPFVQTNPGINVKSTRGRAFVGNNGGIKRGRQIPLIKNYPASKPSVINNIQIIVNDNKTEVLKNEDPCNGESICNVSVSTKSDSRGNLVTDVHVQLVTKLNKKPPNIQDVPVITGYRGTLTRRIIQPPRFHYLNKPPQFIRTYSPQVQVHGADNEGNFHNGWYYSNNNGKFTPEVNFVDDKIEAPLSKTITENSAA